MANKVVYNNASYDILDAITLFNKDYLILVNENEIRNIIFVESSVVDGKRKYFLPPKSYKVEDNPNCNLRRLQTNYIIHSIVEILKKSSCETKDELTRKIIAIKTFIYTDDDIEKFIKDESNLNLDKFNVSLDIVSQILEQKFGTNKHYVQESAVNYLNRPIKTMDGLDYDWLYELSLQELQELASSNRTSEELIYILDALKKAEQRELSINHYLEMGKVYRLNKPNPTSAFVDTLLLSIITLSFSLLFLLSIF